MPSSKQVNHDKWLKEGQKIGASYVLDVCDTYDHSNYPVYVMPGDDLNKRKEEYSTNMQRVESVIEVLPVLEKVLETPDEIKKKLGIKKSRLFGRDFWIGATILIVVLGVSMWAGFEYYSAIGRVVFG